MEKETKNSNVNKNIQNDLLQEYTCAICLLLLVEPIRTECNHNFCFYCFEEMKDSHLWSQTFKCPLCRESLDKEKINEIDLNLEAKIIELFPKEYLEKFKALEKSKKLNSSLFKIRIIFGNTHSLIIEGNNKNDDNRHKWKMFLKLEGIKDEGKFIEKVEFKLHPTFTDNLIEMKKAPFEFSRIGWGIFNIPIKIVRKPLLNLEPTELSHFFSFEQNIKSDVKIIKIDKSLIERHNLI